MYEYIFKLTQQSIPKINNFNLKIKIKSIIKCTIYNPWLGQWYFVRIYFQLTNGK